MKLKRDYNRDMTDHNKDDETDDFKRSFDREQLIFIVISELCVKVK